MKPTNPYYSCIIRYLLKPWGSKRLYVWGFVLMVISFAILGALYTIDESSDSSDIIDSESMKTYKFVMLCIITFAINFGPNVASFVSPTECFPSEVRATFHGISATLAKFGAVIGSFMFAPISETFGLSSVMWVQVVIALLGVVVTKIYLDDTPPYGSDQEDPQPAAAEHLDNNYNLSNSKYDMLLSDDQSSLNSDYSEMSEDCPVLSSGFR